MQNMAYKQEKELRASRQEFETERENRRIQLQLETSGYIPMSKEESNWQQTGQVKPDITAGGKGYKKPPQGAEIIKMGGRDFLQEQRNGRFYVTPLSQAKSEDPATIKLYERAKAEGFKGNLLDYQMKLKGQTPTTYVEGDGFKFFSGDPSSVSRFAPTKTTSNKIQKDLMALDDEVYSLKGMMATYKPEFTEVATKVGASYASWQEKYKGTPIGKFLGNVTPEDKQKLDEYTDWRHRVYNQLATVIPEKAGANFTKTEEKLYMRDLPDPGKGWFDGDSATEFERKARNKFEMALMAKARRQYYLMAKNSTPDEYSSMTKKGGVVSLSDMKGIINSKADEEARKMRSLHPEYTEQQINAHVKSMLNKIFGL